MFESVKSTKLRALLMTVSLVAFALLIGAIVGLFLTYASIKVAVYTFIVAIMSFLVYILYGFILSDIMYKEKLKKMVDEK
jgi:flagellar biosynthesis protein FliQ